jgi:maltose phosphorylase
MSVVEGFGGMRVRNEHLVFNPFLPKQWNSFSFKVGFRGALLNIRVSKEGVQIINQSNKPVNVSVYDKPNQIAGKSQILVNHESEK